MQFKIEPSAIALLSESVERMLHPGARWHPPLKKLGCNALRVEHCLSATDSVVPEARAAHLARPAGAQVALCSSVGRSAFALPEHHLAVRAQGLTAELAEQLRERVDGDFPRRLKQSVVVQLSSQHAKAPCGVLYLFSCMYVLLNRVFCHGYHLCCSAKDSGCSPAREVASKTR